MELNPVYFIFLQQGNTNNLKWLPSITMISVQRLHQSYLCFTLFVFHHQFFSACYALPRLVLISVSFMCCSCCCDEFLQVSLLRWWDTDDFSSPASTLCRCTPCLTGQDSSACWSASALQGFVLFALFSKVLCCLLIVIAHFSVSKLLLHEI